MVMSAKERNSHPHFEHTVCFRCRFFDGDIYSPLRMGFCKTAKNPNAVIKVKTTCDKYEPREEYQ